MGALATGDQVDVEKFGMGANGVRCVYAREGAVVRGFTLTGGRGVGSSWDSGNGAGAAFYSETARAATVEDCIITNNGANKATICQAVVRRCRVIGNVARTSNSGVAGYSCDWYDSIIDGNEANGTVFDARAFENCTIGTRNVYAGGGANPNVLSWNTAEDRSIKNSVVLGGTYTFAGGGRIFCTNCLIASTLNAWTTLPAEQSHGTIFTNDTGAVVDSEYRPTLGSFVGIDKGEAAYSTDALGGTDVYGTPRVLNGAMDMGAVEYDWRPAYSSELGRRFKVVYASPSVTTNATGGVRIPDGAVAGTVGLSGPFELSLAMTGGNLAVYVGGALVGECSGSGEHSMRFTVPDAAAEVRFAYTPEAGSVAVLKKFASARGFTICIR